MGKAEDLLAEQIEELKHKIHMLEIEKDEREYDERWRWRHIRKLKGGTYDDVVDTNFDLPTPRLEIRLQTTNFGRTQADYGLVLEHLVGHIDFIPIGSTRMDGGFRPALEKARDEDERQAWFKQHLQLPFRDGAHIAHDAHRLNLPAYVVNVAEDCYRKIRFKLIESDRDPGGVRQVLDEWDYDDIEFLEVVEEEESED